MSDRDALLAAILADPADDTARLVFADCLTENGEGDRGEFIRVEVELARTPPLTEDDERRRKVLLTRRDELFKQHSRAWLEPFVPHARDVKFERGFVQSLEVPGNLFLQHAGRWFALTPLTRVKFTRGSVFDVATNGNPSWVEALFVSPYITRLETLDLTACLVHGTGVRHLAAAPPLPRLRDLVLAWNAIRNEGALALAGMKQLAGLEALNLVGNGITDYGARALAESPYLGGVKELHISRNPIKKKCWAMLGERFGQALVG
jgi:uncharacterized protein (TIGR02996 family)